MLLVREIWSFRQMRTIKIFLSMILAGALAVAQPPAKKKHILVIGQTKGFQHDSVSDAMV
jgi:hypothetical protein